MSGVYSYHVFIYHPDMDELIRGECETKEEIIEIVRKAVREREPNFIYALEVHVVHGAAEEVTLTGNNLVLQLGSERFLAD